jgi:hypothetical protein
MEEFNDSKWVKLAHLIFGERFTQKGMDQEKFEI